MFEYVLRRIVLIVPTMLLVSLILFALARIVPGDAIDIIVNSDLPGSYSAAQKAQLRKELGLSDPLPVQYAKWISRAVRFDFGTSFWANRSVWSLIKERFPRTLEIALVSIVIAVVWGVTSGVLSAVYQDRWVDYVIRVLTLGGIALPNFFVAVMIFYLLILLFGWIPPIRFENLYDNPARNLQQIAAPCLVLGFGAGAGISRLTRSQFLDVYREDYIRTARSKGLAERAVVFRHALRNSLLPVVTVAGLLLGGLLGGVVIAEQVFAIPGMGTLMVTAIAQKDYPLLQGLVWFISFFYILSNLVVDITYARIDPRIRYR